MSHKSFFLGALYAWCTVAALVSFAGKQRLISYLMRTRWDEWMAPSFTLLGIAVAAAHLFYKWRDG